MTEFVLAYSTAPDEATAKNIAKVLVESQLAACVNLLPQMHSIYRWKGQMEEAQEWVLLIKTQKIHQAKLEEKLQEIHPYECPCLIYLAIDGGIPAYLEWLKIETTSLS